MNQEKTPEPVSTDNSNNNDVTNKKKRVRKKKGEVQLLSTEDENIPKRKYNMSNRALKKQKDLVDDSDQVRDPLEAEKPEWNPQEQQQLEKQQLEQQILEQQQLTQQILEKQQLKQQKVEQRHLEQRQLTQHQQLKQQKLEQHNLVQHQQEQLQQKQTQQKLRRKHSQQNMIPLLQPHPVSTQPDKHLQRDNSTTAKIPNSFSKPPVHAAGAPLVQQWNRPPNAVPPNREIRRAPPTNFNNVVPNPNYETYYEVTPEGDLVALFCPAGESLRPEGQSGSGRNQFIRGIPFNPALLQPHQLRQQGLDAVPPNEILAYLAGTIGNPSNPGLYMPLGPIDVHGTGGLIRTGVRGEEHLSDQRSNRKSSNRDEVIDLVEIDYDDHSDRMGDQEHEREASNKHRFAEAPNNRQQYRDEHIDVESNNQQEAERSLKKRPPKSVLLNNNERSSSNPKSKSKVVKKRTSLIPPSTRPRSNSNEERLDSPESTRKSGGIVFPQANLRSDQKFTPSVPRTHHQQQQGNNRGNTLSMKTKVQDPRASLQYLLPCPDVIIEAPQQNVPDLIQPILLNQREEGITSVNSNSSNNRSLKNAHMQSGVVVHNEMAISATNAVNGKKGEIQRQQRAVSNKNNDLEQVKIDSDIRINELVKVLTGQVDLDKNISAAVVVTKQELFAIGKRIQDIHATVVANYCGNNTTTNNDNEISRSDQGRVPINSSGHDSNEMKKDSSKRRSSAENEDIINSLQHELAKQKKIIKNQVERETRLEKEIISRKAVLYATSGCQRPIEVHLEEVQDLMNKIQEQKQKRKSLDEMISRDYESDMESLRKRIYKLKDELIMEKSKNECGVRTQMISTLQSLDQIRKVSKL